MDCNTRRCVIIGCARNIAAQLPRTLEKIESIRAYWEAQYNSETAVVIGENGSTDSTKPLLAAYQAIHPRTHILTLDAGANAIEQRTNRLAFVRNALLDFIHTPNKHNEHNEHNLHTYTYLLIVDMDGTLDDFDPTSLNNVFDSRLPQSIGDHKRHTRQ